MTELEKATRTVGVHVKNATWLTNDQLKSHLNAHRLEIDSSLSAIAIQLDHLIDAPKSVTGRLIQAGEYIEIDTGNKGYVTLAIDGDGEEFEAAVVVLYQARPDGEFIPVKLRGSDGVEVTETTSTSAIYKVLAPQGQAIRAIVKSYSYGSLYITLTAMNKGSY
jgi:hypothetical protein